MSNNSHNEISIYEAIKSAPDYILEILSVLEEILREFNVTVNYKGNSTTITIQDKKTIAQQDALRTISLKIFTKPKSYEMNLYHNSSNNKKATHVYKIKVKGNYELEVMKDNLEKLIQGKDLSHQPNYYPF
ncbi:MAG: hypothetical protein ACFE8G_08825 [Candidatus Hermodarchaeota archaeon]